MKRKNQKTSRVTFRLTNKQRAALERAASKKGIEPSALIREAVEQTVGAGNPKAGAAA